METEYVVNALALNLSASEYLVITVIQFLATHDAHLL